MPAARIEQDWMRKTALGRILIGSVDVVDDDMTTRPARAFRITPVIGRAIDGPAARFHAALLGNAQDRLVRVRQHRRKSAQNSQDNGCSGNLHGQPPILYRRSVDAACLVHSIYL